MAIGKWLVFDTTVYIAAIRSGRVGLAARALETERRRTYLASVVSAELRAGATTRTSMRAVREFTMWAHDVRRVVAPSADSWDRAGDVLARIGIREPRLRTKVPGLWKDLLVALSARQIGATVVTDNVDDFEILRRYVRFDLQPLSAAD